MTDRLREPVGVLAGLAILLLMLVFCTDEVGPAKSLFLSAPVPAGAPVPSPLAWPELPPWERLWLTLDTPWQPLRTPAAAVAGVVVAAPRELEPHALRSGHPGTGDQALRPRRRRRRALFSWLKRRRPDPCGASELERAPEPPAPDSLRRSTRGLQFGIRF